MAEVTHILCPIDFSDHSRHALEHAVAFATWYSARITAMHVPVGFAAAAPGIDAPDADAAVPATLPTRPEDLLDELRAFVEPARRARVRVDVRIDEGSAADEILRLEQELAIDLIVLGTHGRSGFEQLVLGSVAQKVLRKASCPVLTIPPPAEDLTASVPVLLERILCPLDFSEASLRALEHALSLRDGSARPALLAPDVLWSHHPSCGPGGLLPRPHAPSRLIRRYNRALNNPVLRSCRPSAGRSILRTRGAARGRMGDQRCLIDLASFGPSSRRSLACCSPHPSSRDRKPTSAAS